MPKKGSSLVSLLIFLVACSSNSSGPALGPSASTPSANPITANTMSVASPAGLYQFGSIASGSNSSIEAFVFKNSGPTLTNCTVSLGDTTHFTVTQSTCGAQFFAGSTCSVSVQANSASIGTFQSSLSLSCSANGFMETVGAPIVVNVISNAIGTIAGSGYFAPTEAGIDSSTVATFTVSNPLSTSVSGCGAPYLSDANDFYVYGSSCGTSIPAWSQCDFYVKSNPKSAGTITSNLNFTCSTGGTFTFNDSLTVASSLPSLAWVQGSSVTLTQSLSSWTQESDFTVQNQSTYASASACQPVVITGDTSAFTIDASSLNAQVAAAQGFLGPWGVYDRVKVTPNATAVGTYTLVLGFSCNNTPVIGTQSAQLTLTLKVTP